MGRCSPREATGCRRPSGIRATGLKLAQIPSESARNVHHLLFTPDGRSVIFACQDRRVLSWHFAKPAEPITSLAGHTKEVWALAYTPDGSTLISAGDDHSIKLWNSRTGTLRADAEGARLAGRIPGGEPRWQDAGQRGLRQGRADLGPPRRTSPRRAPRTHRSGSRRGLRPGAGSSPRPAPTAPSGPGTRRVVHRSGSFEGTPTPCAPWPSNPVARCSSRRATIGPFAGGTSRKVGRPSPFPCPRHCSTLSFSPDGNWLAAGDDWGNVAIWDVATWSRRTSAKGSGAPVWNLAFAPDGRTLAAACGDAKVRLLDPVTGQVTLVLDGHAQRVNAVAFSPDGRTLASASHDGAIKLWHAGRTEARIARGGGTPRCEMGLALRESICSAQVSRPLWRTSCGAANPAEAERSSGWRPGFSWTANPAQIPPEGGTPTRARGRVGWTGFTGPLA